MSTTDGAAGHMISRRLRIAAIQIETTPGDVAGNLGKVERLAIEALRTGVDVLALPEFFTGAVIPSEQAFRTALPASNVAVDMLLRLALRYGACVGGSMLVADGGELFNRYYLAEPGQRLHVHDKDIPTMWENAFYRGGSDDGVFDTAVGRLGAAVCWELIRYRTVERMSGRVDFVISGTHWWDLPWNWPGNDRGKMKFHVDNARMSEQAPAEFARQLGVPVVQASHSGGLKGDCYLLPGLDLRVPYETRFVGCTQIVDAAGGVLASRNTEEGPGIVTAAVEIGGSVAKRERAADKAGRYWIAQLPLGTRVGAAVQARAHKSVYKRFGRRLGLEAAASAIRPACGAPGIGSTGDGRADVIPIRSAQL
jgi:predicted amidohydrolase